MKLSNIPFETLDWHTVPVTSHAGEHGVAFAVERQRACELVDRGELSGHGRLQSTRRAANQNAGTLNRPWNVRT